jgi:hypothetical protein
VTYDCMAFGWFQEFLSEERVDDLAAAEARVRELLDGDAMIVHVYRETDGENPELIGRHGRLCAFTAGNGSEIAHASSATHEICRFLLDTDGLEMWQAAKDRDALIDSRWLVVDLYPQGDQSVPAVYGKAMLRRRENNAQAV